MSFTHDWETCGCEACQVRRDACVDQAKRDAKERARREELAGRYDAFRENRPRPGTKRAIATHYGAHRVGPRSVAS